MWGRGTTSHSDAGSVMGLVPSGCRGKVIEIRFVYVDRARNCAKNDTLLFGVVFQPQDTLRKGQKRSRCVFFHGLLVSLGSERLAKIDEKASISRLFGVLFQPQDTQRNGQKRSRYVFFHGLLISLCSERLA